jgi:histidine triad (HIT) family protein
MSDCPFCDYAGPSPILDVYAGAYVIEPLFPVTEGHALVIPRRHVRDAAEDVGATMGVFAAAAHYVRDRDIAEFNFITSAGRSATQTVMHFHVHVIPRRHKDGVLLPWSHPDTVRRYIEETPIRKDGA